MERRYKDLVNISGGLAIAIERYQKSLADKNIDAEIREDRLYSVIKKFELTYDLLWKYLRKYIANLEGVTVDSPRKVFQQCLSLGLINSSETEDLMTLIEDRNLTTHVYDGDLANKVANDIQKYYDAIKTVIKKVSLDSIKT